MTEIILCGAAGRMGRAVTAAAAANNCKIVAGVERAECIPSSAGDFNIVSNIVEITVHADVIVDFSHHSAVDQLIPYAKKNHIPLVIATTGHNEEELSRLHKLSATVPVFYSRNMSLGINLLLNLCKKAASILGEDYDVEIIEKHHNQKLDAPSGTALMLAEAIKKVRGESEFIFDRTTEHRLRRKNEIGIQSVRGGNIIGEHEVMFCGNNEVITLSHSASNRELLADGALRAAAFIKTKKKGMYSMKELLDESTAATVTL